MENSSFAGFQMDTRGQYLAYGALRSGLDQPDWPVKPFVQIFGLQQRFYVRDENQLLPGQITQIAPTLGLSKTIGSLELQVSGGPAFLISHMENLLEDQNENLVRQKETTYQVGYLFSGFAQYWKESHGFEGLFTYMNLDTLLYGRARWFYADYETPDGTPITPGLEVIGVTNSHSQFNQVFAGALLQTEIKKVEFLLKGGYQNNTTFHGGGYGGIEVYVRF